MQQPTGPVLGSGTSGQVEAGRGAAVPPPAWAPPVMPGLIPKPPAQWPMVIGVIAVVFGAFGVLGSLWGAASSLMMPWITSMTPPPPGAGGSDPGAVLDAMMPWMTRLGVLQALGVPVAALLAVGGIGLIRRAGWSGSVVLWWAGLKVLLGMGIAVAMGLMQRDQMLAVANMNGGSGAPMPAGLGAGLGMLTAVLTAGWACALPTFMIIWFTRPGVRELVAGWRRERAGRAEAAR